MIKKALADSSFFFSLNDIFPLFFSFPKGNRNISFLFTAQLIAVGFLPEEISKTSRQTPLIQLQCHYVPVLMRMLEGGLCSWKSQRHHPSDSLGSGGLSPAELPTNVFLGLLLFLIAHRVFITSKVFAHQDHQSYLRGVSEN